MEKEKREKERQEGHDMEWACMSHAGSRCEKDDQPNKKHTHEHIKPKYGKNV